MLFFLSATEGRAVRPQKAKRPGRAEAYFFTRESIPQRQMLSRVILKKIENIFKSPQINHLRLSKIAVPQGPPCYNSPLKAQNALLLPLSFARNSFSSLYFSPSRGRASNKKCRTGSSTITEAILVEGCYVSQGMQDQASCACSAKLSGWRTNRHRRVSRAFNSIPSNRSTLSW